MPRRKWTRDRLNTIEQLLAKGKPYPEIAREMGTSQVNLRYLIHHYKLKSRGGNRGKSIKKIREDLATRIRILRGEEIRQTEPVFGFTDDQLRRWFPEEHGIDALQTFCKEVLNIELQGYQLKMSGIMHNHRRSCFVLGRQSGKDFTTACFVVWDSVIHSNRKTLIVSPAQRQSDLLFDRIIRFIAQSKELFDSVKSSTREHIAFTNGSIIKSYPSTSYIRGETEVTHAILNEARDFANGEEVLASVVPMLALKRGNLSIMSSPAGCMGILWDCFNSPEYHTMQLPSSVNKYIDNEWIMEQERTLPATTFQMEFEAQFSEAVDNFFPSALVRKCTETYDFSSFPQPGHTYYLGIDWGRIRDSSVLTVLDRDREGSMRIEKIVELVNTPFSSQLAHVQKLHDTFKFTMIVPEKNGLSMPLCEKLKEMGLPTTDFESTITKKAEGYNTLLKELEKGTLVIPNHPKLQYQLRTFRFVMTRDGKMKLHHASSSGHDDYCDSLMLSVYAPCHRRPGYWFPKF
jgi:phage terminase large subunit-like protein